jgi:ferric-dicitrate binding protein FerR (iron transport regulator)
MSNMMLEQKMNEAQDRMTEWQETLDDADNELHLARQAKDKQAIKEAQEVWNWAKARHEAACGRMAALMHNIDPDEYEAAEPEGSAESSETQDSEPEAKVSEEEE